MKLFFPLVFLFFVQPLIYSQDTLMTTARPDSVKYNKPDSLIHIGIELYPKLTGCFATSEVENAHYFNFADSRLFALTAGITVKYSIKPWLLISSGFSMQYLAAESAVMPADIDMGLLYDYTVLYGLKQIEIPLNLELHHGSGLFAGFGTSITALVRGQQSIVYQISPVMSVYHRYTSNANNMNITLNAEAGYTFSMKEFNQVRISCSVQRFMKDNLNEFNEAQSYTLSLPPLKFLAAGIKLVYLI